MAQSAASCATAASASASQSWSSRFQSKGPKRPAAAAAALPQKRVRCPSDSDGDLAPDAAHIVKKAKARPLQLYSSGQGRGNAAEQTLLNDVQTT